MDLAKMREAIRTYNEKYHVDENSSYAEKLREKLTSNERQLSKQEYLDLSKEIDAFFASDAPEEDKKMLSGYTESLLMICSAIEQGLI